MGSPEQSFPSQPEHPSSLPPELAAFLRDQEIACLMHETNQGTAFVVKLPTHELASLRGHIAIAVRHELYAHPAAPVIRTLLTLHDRPDAPFLLEAFTNIEDAQQRGAFATLSQQDTFLMLFYDEALRHRLTKVVTQTDPARVAVVLSVAGRLLAEIPPAQFDLVLQDFP